MIIIQIIEIAQWLILAYFGIASLYLLFYAIASLFYKEKEKKEADKFRRFLILIPAYKEDFVIQHVAEDSLNQNYSKDLYDVCVIADSLKATTIEKLKKLPINVLEVQFEQSSKAKAINKALSVIPENYDAIAILDADNLMDPDFLNSINNSMSYGFKAIQAHRIAKNINTHIALLDAISEEINNSIFRKGHLAVGMSSALIGSGMAFDYMLYKNLMKDIDTFAEDKELEFKLFMKKERIDYLDDVLVYDEKVSKAEVFITQRSRWIAFQLIYATKYFFISFYELFVRFNIDFFDKVFQQFLPPRIFLLGLSVIFTTLSILLNSGTLFYAWIIELTLVILALAFAVPRNFYIKKTVTAFFQIPRGFILMISSLFRFQKAQDDFGATPHTQTSLSEKEKKNINKK